MKKQSPYKKNGFMTFFTALCTSHPTQEQAKPKEKNKVKGKIQKVPRLTFLLDRALVKLSRKNIAEQQFMQNEVLTLHLQKHLASRLKLCSIVVFEGQFSTFLTERIPYAIHMKQHQEQAHQPESNYLLFNNKQYLKFKNDSVDAIVCQLYYGDNQIVIEREGCDNINKQQTVNSSTPNESIVVSDPDRIEEMLRFYYKSVNNFIFICNKSLQEEDIHNLFVIFKQYYLFEFEKVKMVQKVVCNLVYISSNPKFLRIDNKPLVQFLVQQFQKFNVFQKPLPILKLTPEKHRKSLGIKSSIKDLEQLKYRKTLQQILAGPKLADKDHFQEMLNQLLQLDLHVQVSVCLGIILSAEQKKSDIINWFLDMMYERAPVSRFAIDAYQSQIKREQQQDDHNKSYSQMTPIFEVRPHDSVNYSKRTALFKTKGSGDYSNLHYDSRESGGS